MPRYRQIRSGVAAGVMGPALHVVSTSLPEPPYPKDTRSNGWKPEVDWQRIRASASWKLCPPEMRNHLLRLWLECWNEYPVGSFENNLRVIAASIDIPHKTLEAHREELLSGWVLHSDGRLYHPVITEMVLAMVERRFSTRRKVADWRAKKKQQVSECVTGNTRLLTVSNPPEQEQEQDKEIKDTHPTDESGKTKVSPPVPYKQILDLWREILPQLPQPHDVEHWTPARKAQIRARWQNELPDIDTWRAVFEDVKKSPFLMGQVKPRNDGGRPFRCELFWITKPENLLKLSEGRWHG